MLKKNNFLNYQWHNFFIAALLFAFYPLLYFTNIFNEMLYAIGFLEGVSWYKWYFYGFLYTLAVLIGGIRFIIHHKNERYQVIRTSSIMFVQLVLAFIIPLLMMIVNNWDYYFSYLWPLKEQYFFPEKIAHLPSPIIFYSFFASGIAVPFLAFFVGKRWYCSWVCGCGGLANTAGDPYRHLSSKTMSSWKFERYAIHTVLIIAVATTILVILDTLSKKGVLHFDIRSIVFVVTKWYFFIISFGMAGLLGVALYPIFGTRVWCRFFCPMAALLGLFQKMGRFRITTQKDTCISCGNCSKYCEMGIDVRSYAQRNLNIKRASCVGCGMCAHVCPRGVLKLEIKK